MTIPMLTPSETAIYDDDIIAELEKQFDDGRACSLSRCNRSAEYMLVNTCCGEERRPICGPCLIKTREGWLDAGERWAPDGIVCGACRHAFPPRAPFDAVWKVVPL